MRKILLLCNKVPFPPRDGSTIAMASHIRGLLSSGADLTVIALNTTKHYVDLSTTVLPETVNWHIVDANTTPTFAGGLANLLFSKRSYMVSRFYREDVLEKIRAAISETDFDFAIAEGLFMMPYAGELRKAGIPVILRAHNVEHHIWQRQIDRETNSLRTAFLRRQNARLKEYEIASCAVADFIVPISEEDARWFSGYKDLSRIHTMPCGIRPTDYPDCPSDVQDVFHIGAMDWLPNTDGIRWFEQKVWPEVLRADAQAVFHLAGRDSDQLGIHQPQNGFFVHGTVDSASVFYRNHGIFVVPLHAGSGMRIKVMEAMSFGKAIVSTSVGVEGIPAEHLTEVWIEDDPKAFAEAVVTLLRDKPRRLAMGIAARAKAMSIFDEDQLAKDLLNILDRQAW